MTEKYQLKKIQDLSQFEYRRLRNLTISEESPMRDGLAIAMSQFQNSYVVICGDEEIYGWGLLMPSIINGINGKIDNHFDIINTETYPDGEKVNIMIQIFVRKDCRRKGIGRNIFNKLRTLYVQAMRANAPLVMVAHSHDKLSSHFWNTVVNGYARIQEDNGIITIDTENDLD